ncbi:FUSC family protein [Martelella alba]|uniref:FUSC family protein n=1 Tax=Martelella alba TaxID=2590451 RepID=A0A506UJ62_9HYPH|nr:FUSC family protein [Martelella alba]TPW33365.1 FUSC family protein [Martelella alba]
MAPIVETSDFRRKTLRLIDDLKPFPGRLYQAVSIGIICAISISIAMLYHFPEAAIGCYLVIFMAKPNAAENVVTGVGLIIAVSLVVFLLIGLINLTIDHPPAQIAAIIISSFIFLYMDSATKLGEQAGIVALVIAFVMTLLGYIPIGEIATRAVLYAWAMVFVPMATLALYNLFFGIPPQKLLRQAIAERLRTTADFLTAADPEARDKLVELIGKGTAEQDKLLQMIGLFRLLNRKDNAFLTACQAHSYRLMLAALARDNAGSAEHRSALAGQCRDAAGAIEAKKPLAKAQSATPGDEDHGLDDVEAALAALLDATPPEKGAPLDDPFIAADAFSNPIHLQFALKTTLAAFTCYFIYTAIDWQGIHTAMITCYVAALGTTGETVHKLLLRITGCLIGALIGLLTILFIIPQLESIGGLAIVIFLVVAFSAWISTGSERISYGGVQIALAFLLTVIQGFKPGTDLSAASDRIFGILLGNAVVYIIFTTIWPVSISYAVKNNILAVTARLKTLADLPFAERRASLGLIALIQTNLGNVRNALDMAGYEPRAVRPTQNQRQAVTLVTDKLNHLTLGLFFRPEISGEMTAEIDAITDKFADRDSRAPAEPALTGKDGSGDGS